MKTRQSKEYDVTEEERAVLKLLSALCWGLVLALVFCIVVFGIWVTLIVVGHIPWPF